MFEAMIESIQQDTIRLLLKAEVRQTPVQRRPAVSELQQGGGATETETRGTVRSTKKVGRNDPCPCGSGKKYKNCCGNN